MALKTQKSGINADISVSIPIFYKRTLFLYVSRQKETCFQLDSKL